MIGLRTITTSRSCRRLVKKRLPEGFEGLSKLHELIATAMPTDWAQLDPDEAADRVKIGIETERGPWVAALITAGYEVFAIKSMSTARYRERHSTSGAKSDAGDAHVLAEIVRLDRAHHRPVAGDSDDGEALKLLTRAHQSLIWDRTRHPGGQAPRPTDRHLGRGAPRRAVSGPGRCSARPGTRRGGRPGTTTRCRRLAAPPARTGRRPDPARGAGGQGRPAAAAVDGPGRGGCARHRPGSPRSSARTRGRPD